MADIKFKNLVEIIVELERTMRHLAVCLYREFFKAYLQIPQLVTAKLASVLSAILQKASEELQSFACKEERMAVLSVPAIRLDYHTIVWM